MALSILNNILPTPTVRSNDASAPGSTLPMPLLIHVLQRRLSGQDLAMLQLFSQSVDTTASYMTMTALRNRDDVKFTPFELWAQQTFLAHAAGARWTG